MARRGVWVRAAMALFLAACSGLRNVPTAGGGPGGQPNGDDAIDGVGPDALANVEKLADGEILLGLLTSRTAFGLK